MCVSMCVYVCMRTRVCTYLCLFVHMQYLYIIMYVYISVRCIGARACVVGVQAGWRREGFQIASDPNSIHEPVCGACVRSCVYVCMCVVCMSCVCVHKSTASSFCVGAYSLYVYMQYVSVYQNVYL